MPGPVDTVEAIIHDSIADIRDEPAPEGVEEALPVVEEPAAVVEEPAAVVTEEAAKPATVDHVAAAAAAAKKKAEDAAKPADDADDFSKIPERDAQGRVNRIPHTRVAKMVESGSRKAVDEFKTKEHAPLVERATTYETRLKEIEKVESAMFDDQPRFLAMLETIPGYAALFATRYGGGKAPAAAEGVKTAPTVADDPEPEPDVKDAAGVVIGYSAEGHKKLREWDRRQATRDAEERLGKRIEPFENSVKEREAAARVGAEINASLDAAVKWDGFVEHSDDIVKAMEADRLEAIRTRTAPKLKTLLDAYMAVVPGKLKGNRDTMRAQVMDELAKAPKSTAVASAAASRTAATILAPGVDPIEQAIRDSLKGLPGR